ncbi:MAG: hypothetical protein ACLT29_01410 [Ruminococcus callidus]
MRADALPRAVLEQLRNWTVYCRGRQCAVRFPVAQTVSACCSVCWNCGSVWESRSRRFM